LIYLSLLVILSNTNGLVHLKNTLWTLLVLILWYTYFNLTKIMNSGLFLCLP